MPLNLQHHVPLKDHILIEDVGMITVAIIMQLTLSSTSAHRAASLTVSRDHLPTAEVGIIDIGQLSVLPD